MEFFKKGSAIFIAGIMLLSCTACSGLDKLADGLKSGVEQVGSNVAIGKSNALITPYQSFDGKRVSDNAETLTSKATIAERLQYTIPLTRFPVFAGWYILTRNWRKMYWLKMGMAALQYSLKVVQTI